MRTKNTLGQIQPVVEDVTESIDKCSRSLEEFFKDPESIVFEQESIQGLKKLSGIFTMLDMQGALRLIKDTLVIVSRLQNHTEDKQKQQFQAVSYALTMLSRYVDYVRNKHYDLPELLLPVINDLRKVAGAPELDESFFFTIDPGKPRKGRTDSTEQLASKRQKSRYIRQMYQMGLIEVLRKTNLAGGLKMMRRALAQFDKQYRHPRAANLWWIAQGVMHSFTRNDLLLTNRRLRLFSDLDRQMRELGLPENQQKESALQKALPLASYCLYLIAIAQSADPESRKIRQFFGIQEQDVNDRVLQSESLLINGPAHKDYESLASAINEELDKIQVRLHDDEQAFERRIRMAIKSFLDIGRLLDIIQMDQETTRIEVVNDLLRTALAKADNTAETAKKELNMVDIAIDHIRKALQQNIDLLPSQPLEQQFSMDKEAQMTCKATRAVLQSLMKTLDDYQREGFPRELLDKASEQLRKVSAGIKALNFDDLAALAQDTEKAFQKRIILANNDTPSEQLALLADILASIEFYLETVENSRSPSQRIMAFAHESLSQLNQSS